MPRMASPSRGVQAAEPHRDVGQAGQHALDQDGQHEQHRRGDDRADARPANQREDQDEERDPAHREADRAGAVLAEAGSLFQDTGNLVYLPWFLEGLASLAAGQGDYGRAAGLAGARDALRDQIGVFLPPVQPAGYHRALEAARASLTPEAFEAAHSRLAGQPPPQIVAAALGTRADHARTMAGDDATSHDGRA